MKARWDIFCRVVDNYGDIGVTWRLARQLSVEHLCEVSLWVDDLRTLALMCPEIDVHLDRQWQEGVDIHHWPLQWHDVPAADVVIAAFACQLPLDYMEVMASCERTPLWINLDYLSAEDWVAGCHLMPSVKFKGVQKYFFFPGFRLGTGGLLRESGLLEQRQEFQKDHVAQQRFLQVMGVFPAMGVRLISLFAYENAGISGWLDLLAMDGGGTHLLVPEGRILGDVERWLGVEYLAAGDIHKRDALTVQVLPFVSQEKYDRILWCCDFNIVRGEDSFVRAQWAARPLMWHIYRQDEDTHLQKLNAFLELYTTDLSPGSKAALVSLWKSWNADLDIAQPWKMLLDHWVEVSLHAQKWSIEQGLKSDLAIELVQFYESWI